MGACALILLVLPATAQSQSDADLGAQLTRHLSTMKKDRQVLRFFEAHGWLLSDPRFAVEAKRQLRLHTSSLDAGTSARQLRRRSRSRAAPRRRRLAAVAAASPANVICRVFGDYCREALAVSRCESGLRTDAQNGQYLGLFQMGSSERRLFGHGASATEQADGRPPVLRRLGPRLEPVVLQALELSRRPHVSSAKCGTRPVGRVPTTPETW